MADASNIMYTIGKVVNVIGIVVCAVLAASGIAVIAFGKNAIEPSEVELTAAEILALGITLLITGIICLILEIVALVFAVKDTGRGMDPETLGALRRRLAEKQSAQTPGGSGFGLVNVNLRLRLYYNSKDGLSIESGLEGTTVSFCVPRRTREEIENDQSLSG